MKHLKTVLSIVVLICVVFLNGDAPDKSTTYQTVTIEYESDVPDAVANSVAREMRIWGVGEEQPIKFRITNEKGDYRVHIGYEDDELSDDFRNEASLLLRLLSETSPNKPIYMQVASDNQGTLEVLKPAMPLDDLCFHNGNYLFHSESISPSEAVVMAQALERIGYTSKEQRSVARVVRRDDQYELYLCYSDGEVSLEDATIAQHNLFADAKATVAPCGFDLKPIQKNTVHYLEGFRPGETSLEIVDDVHVVHDDSVSSEAAIAIANRVLVNKRNGSLPLTLTGQDNNYELSVPWREDSIDEGLLWIGLAAGEAFSELDNAETVRGVLVEGANKRELAARTVAKGNGALARFRNNRLYYPKGTPQSLLDDLQRDLKSVGLFGEEESCIVRLHDESNNGEYTVQLAIVAEELDLAEFWTGLQQEIRADFGKIAFPGRSFTLELTNINFKRLGDCVWHDRFDPDEEAIAAEEEPDNATASL